MIIIRNFIKMGLPSEKRMADLKQLAFDNFMVFIEDIFANLNKLLRNFPI